MIVIPRVTKPLVVQQSPIPRQNLALWLRADRGIVLDTTSTPTVSQWLDQSGNGRHATQGTKTLQPSLSEAGLVFNSSYLHTSLPTFTSYSLTSFFVIKPTSTIIQGLIDSALGFPNPFRNYSDYVASSFELWENSPTVSLNLQETNTQLLELSYNLSPNRLLSYSRNGRLVASASSSNTTPVNWRGAVIGAINVDLNFSYKGILKEIVIHTTVLNNAQLASIRNH